MAWNRKSSSDRTGGGDNEQNKVQKTLPQGSNLIPVQRKEVVLVAGGAARAQGSKVNK